MSVNNREGCRTLEWIINKSEQGVFLVIADEAIQKEIIGACRQGNVEAYRQGSVGIYDYRRHSGAYSFQDLHKWVTALPECQTFLIANFQLAIQSDEDLKRLNFSRDMIAGLQKNFIFLTTPYGDDRLALGAYDFYSFFKLRIIFHNDDGEEGKRKDLNLELNSHGHIDSQCDGSMSMKEGLEENELISEIELHSKEELRQKLWETYAMMEQARDEKNRALYRQSERLLLYVKLIREMAVGTDHLELADVNYELGDVYRKQGKYKEAEKLYEKALDIEKQALGEYHPVTANCYENLAILYHAQGKYREAEELHRKVLTIRKEALGECHPATADSYHYLADFYKEQGKCKEAEELYRKASDIRTKVLGEGM